MNKIILILLEVILPRKERGVKGRKIMFNEAERQIFLFFYSFR